MKNQPKNNTTVPLSRDEIVERLGELSWLMLDHNIPEEECRKMTAERDDLLQQLSQLNPLKEDLIY